MRERDGDAGGSEAADEADDDRHVVDLVFGDGEIRVFGIKGAAEEILSLMKDLFEEDAIGRIEDVSPAPLYESLFADKSTGNLITGVEFGFHGVSAHDDSEVITRER